MEYQRGPQVPGRSLRRLSHQCVEWDQRRRWYFPVLHWLVQLLQRRQLGLSTVVRFLPHALVFRGLAGAGFPHASLEDRAVAYQWMAIIRVGQFEKGSGWTD